MQAHTRNTAAGVRRESARVTGSSASRPQSGFTRKGWLMTVALLLLLAGFVGFNSRSAKTSPSSLWPVDPNTPEEREFRRLVVAHATARDEVRFWIRTDIATQKGLSPPPNALMKSRINQRLEPVAAAYQDFLKRNPDHARAARSYGTLLHDLNDDEGLLKQWEQTRGIDARDPDAWRKLGNYYCHIGEIKKCFQCYDKAIELDPTEPVYYQDYATTVFLYRRDAKEHFHLDEQQVFDHALDLYNQALKLDPKNAPLAFDIALCYYVIRPPRVEPALEAWQRVLKLASTDRQRENIYLHLARIEITGKRFERARQYLDRVTNPQFAYTKGRVTNTLAEREKQVAAEAAETKGGTTLD